MDQYFPLRPGTTWKYRVTLRAGTGEPKTTEQSVTIEAQKHGGKTVAVASDNAYAAKDDGVYIIGVVRNGKFEALDEAQKVVPAAPKMGDQWTYREVSGVTSATCLGIEKVKVGAGEFDAAKIYLSTVGGTDQGERRDVYRWFAPGVGPVKGVFTQNRPGADGTVANTEVTMELVSYQAPKAEGVTGAVAGADKPAGSGDALLGDGQALARKGEHRAALAKYDAAIAVDPKAAKVYAYKTLSLIATKQFDAAEAAINRALAFDDRQYTFVEIAGQLKVAQGKVTEGQALYDKAAQLSPSNAGAIYTDLAAALAGRNDDRLAPAIDQALKSAANANPPGVEALFALGQSYVNAGRAEGKQYLQRYVQTASALPADKRDEQKIRLARQLIRAIDAVKGAP
jgi:tetratricopeptide (TPR) repeat protein